MSLEIKCKGIYVDHERQERGVQITVQCAPLLPLSLFFTAQGQYCWR